MSKLKDVLNKMMGKTVRQTQASVGGMGGNATVIAKCVAYDKHRKLCTIYDPVGKEPQQRYRGDDGDMSRYETLQGGRTVKIPWQPVDNNEDRENPDQALEEFHMLGVRDLGDVEPERMYDYIEMLTIFQKINKGTSRFLRLIVDQRKFVNGSGGGINKHWVPQIIVEIQYDKEGWPDTARATRILDTCPLLPQTPTSSSLPLGDPMPCAIAPDGQMFFDRARFESEADWLLNALGAFDRPSQSSYTATSVDMADVGDSTIGQDRTTGQSGNNIPSSIISSPDRPLATIIGPISISDGDATGVVAGEVMIGTVDSDTGNTEVAIADGIITPVATGYVITDPADSNTWEISRDPISGSPRSNRYRMFGFSAASGTTSIPKGAGHTMPKLHNPVQQRHLFGISHFFGDEGPWITIHASYKGTPIMSCGEGVVRFAGYSSLFDCYTIIIEHTHKVVTVYTYCYAPSIAVRKGQHVHEKQIIALMDRTEGEVVMRFGIFDNFSPVNPLNYIKGWRHMRRM